MNFVEAFTSFHTLRTGKHDVPQHIADAHAVYAEAADAAIMRLHNSQHMHGAYSHYATLVIGDTTDYLKPFALAVYEHYANEWGVPYAWVIALPGFVKFDAAGSYLQIDEKDTFRFDEEGNASEATYAAFIEGKESGLHDDEDFLFAREDMAKSITSAIADSLKEMLNENDMTLDEWKKQNDGSEDWSFPA